MLKQGGITLLAFTSLLLVSGNTVQAQFSSETLYSRYSWVGGSGTQSWQVGSNWDPNGFMDPNGFPNEADPNNPVYPEANLSVDLGADLNVSLGTTPVTIAGITMGGTSGAVSTEISSGGPGGILTLKNYFDPNGLTTMVDPDFDQDQTVSGLDFLILQRNLGSTGLGDHWNDFGDANGDRSVDGIDLGIWESKYGYGGTEFSRHAAFIRSDGVAGSINKITAPVHIDNGPLQINGSNPFVFDSSATITSNGNAAFTGSNSSISTVSGATATIDSNIIVGDTDPNGNNVDFGLNSTGLSTGTLIFNGNIVPADPNHTNVVVQFGGGNGRVELYGNNAHTGVTFTGGKEVLLGSNNALGVSATDPNVSAQWQPRDGVVESDDDARTIPNDIFLATNLTVEGDHSLTLSGEITQTNNRRTINNADSSKTLTFDGRISIWGDKDFLNIERRFEFDGTGTTKVTGEIRDLSVDVENDPNTPSTTGQDFRISKRGRGVLIIDVDAGNNTHLGPTVVIGGNMHYADNDSLNSGGGMIRSIGGAVGVDSAIQGSATNATFLGLIDPDSVGGLMINSGETTASITLSGTNAAGMTLAAPETGLTFTGSITPANSTYALGGGEGTLTLPDATLTGSNNLEVRNGGTVELLGDNTYTGTTQIRSKVVVDNLADGGFASSLGAGSDPNDAEEILIHGATLMYVGAGDSTNRLFSIGTAGATIDSSGSGALVFSNSGNLGRRDVTSVIGSLKDNATGAFGATTVYDVQSGVGGDRRDVVRGMKVNDPDPETFFFETFSRCGGDTGLEAVPTGGVSLNSGANCIPLYVDPNNRSSNQIGFDPNSAYKPLDVFVTGVSSSGRSFGFDDDEDEDVYSGTPPVEKLNTTIILGATGRTLTLTGDNADDNEIAGIISDSVAGSVVSIRKTGAGKWILSGSNSYTGDTTVEKGTLSITSAFLDPNSTVRLTPGAFLELDFIGDNVIENLFLDGVELSDGIYGATDGGMGYNVLSVLSGTGFLNVGGVPFPIVSAISTVPEPSTLLLSTMACSVLIRRRRRT